MFELFGSRKDIPSLYVNLTLSPGCLVTLNVLLVLTPKRSDIVDVLLVLTLSVRLQQTFGR